MNDYKIGMEIVIGKDRYRVLSSKENEELEYEISLMPIRENEEITVTFTITRGETP